LSGRTQVAAGGLQTFIAYPISPRPLEDGRWLTNWAARIFVDPARGFAREDWDRRGKRSDVLPLYASWRFDWLDVAGLIEATEAIFEYPMVDRDPLERWTFGRVTLLGDAAHPMYPLGSNGASQAVLDAHALAAALQEDRDPSTALAAYEAERRPRTARIVADNRSGGPEIVIRMAEERAPQGFDDLESVISRDELERISGHYKQLAGFDLASVNA
jgi:2-polyprenyl-6-methoxyphenol hydroxylase-like FAD-dependent oxidoreductase